MKDYIRAVIRRDGGLCALIFGPSFGDVVVMAPLEVNSVAGAILDVVHGIVLDIVTGAVVGVIVVVVSDIVD